MPLSERQYYKLRSAREMEVYKRNDMIQKARFALNVQEQRAVLYAISKIRPHDTSMTEYEFDIKEFYRMIGWKDESYTKFKKMLKDLSDRSWWATIDDEGTESAVRWFTTVRCNKNSGKVVIKFHEDMMPFLLNLANSHEYYTKYSLQYILPMSSQYSPRLYEILKSYQRNNVQWFFDIDELKHLLNCENYKNFKDFRKWVLEPAVNEINKYTDIKIAYLTEKEGRRITRITFLMKDKSPEKLLEAKQAIINVLDESINMDEVRQKSEFKRKFLEED